MKNAESGMRVRPIGIIHSPFREVAGMPIQSAFAGDAEGVVEVFPEYRDGLRDLDGFERVWLLYWFHKAVEARLVVKPFRDDEERGLFATRAPCRPNPIGLSAVRLLTVNVSEGKLRVAGIDVLDGSPLLDIKPYVPDWDAFPASRSGWLERASGRTRSDSRFST